MTNEDLYNAMMKGFSVVGQRLDAMNQRLDAMNQRLEATDQRLEATDQRLDAMDQRLDAMDQRLDALDHRVDALDSRIDAVESDLESQIREVKILIEMKIIPQINEMMVCYTSTYDKYIKGICRDKRTVVEVQQLKETVANHSERLNAAGL